MNVLFASSEIVPFASSGGLGDVAAALPRALARRKTSIARVMPLYRSVHARAGALEDTGQRLAIPMGSDATEAEVWTTEEGGVRTYFIRHDGFFDRPGLYGDAAGDYADNFSRFVFFQKAVVALIDARHEPTELVHGNDWQTGLLPLYLQHGIDGTGRDGTEATIFTVHNLAFQGLFPSAMFPMSNLPPTCFTPAVCEFYGQVSFLKAALTTADLVTTVSATYAEEIRTKALGCGLDDVLRTLGPRLVGILNGVDYSVWDPGVDEYLTSRYGTEELDGKTRCKRDLVEGAGLPYKARTPVVGMVARLADQKGFDILAEAMPFIMSHDVQFVLLGAGQPEYQELCRQWAADWPERFAVTLGFDQELAHRIEAGADIFLMPSRFEPCGLNQMYSLRYGTLPLVHATGGLADTIVDVTDDPRKGNGFRFTDYTPGALVAAFQRAHRLYQDQAAWREVMLRGMAADFSWNKSADAYLKLYRTLSGTRG